MVPKSLAGVDQLPLGSVVHDMKEPLALLSPSLSHSSSLIAAAAVVASLKEENVRLASGGHGELGPPSLTPTMLEAG